MDQPGVDAVEHLLFLLRQETSAFVAAPSPFGRGLR
jgi:hypothetical protein